MLGSVFASTFAPRVVAGLRHLGVPEAAARGASVSMANADAVVGHLPAALQGAAVRVSGSAFIDALHAASAVGAVVSAVGAVLAVAYLGGRTLAAPAEASATIVPAGAVLAPAGSATLLTAVEPSAAPAG